MYRPQAAGHTAREAPRPVEQEDISELVHRAMIWFETKSEPTVCAEDEAHQYYARARDLTRDITTNARTAGFLTTIPAIRQKDDYMFFGAFISALYNYRCPETVIVYEHDTAEIVEIGYLLPKNKILINNGHVGHAFGLDAAGVLINNGITGSFFGQDATGAIITVKPVSVLSDKIVDTSLCAQQPLLKEYVDRLITLVNSDPLAIEAEFGNGEAITAAIRARLRSRARRARRAP